MWLTIVPEDAAVQLDGKAVIPEAGRVALTRPPGALVKVRLEHSGQSRETEVLVSERGAVPDRLELDPPRAAPAAPVVSGNRPTPLRTLDPKTAGRPDLPQPLPR